MFGNYKRVGTQKLSSHISNLQSIALSQFSIGAHSRDAGGDEAVPGFVVLCREYEEYKLSHPTNNTQQQASRIMAAVTQQTLMEAREPLGESGGGLRS